MSQSAGRQPILTGSLKQQNYPELNLKIQAVPRRKHTAVHYTNQPVNAV
jgi:hypothetical protein